MFVNKYKRQSGFTLVELITVVALIALMSVYISVQISRSTDDAKVGLAVTFMLSTMPAAIASYKARNLGQCTGIGDVAILPDNVTIPKGDTNMGTASTAVDASYDATTVKLNLFLRGATNLTPWGDPWSAVYNSPTVGTTVTTDGSKVVIITFPTTGSDDPGQTAIDLAALLDTKAQIVDATSSALGVAVTFSCV